MKSERRGIYVVLRLLLVAGLVVFSVAERKITAEIISFLAIQSAESYLPYNADYSREESAPTTETEPGTARTVATTSATEKAEESLTAVDSDIEALIQKAEAESASDKIDGEIYEYTFTDDGVTDTYGNIRVKNTNKTQPEIEKRLNRNLPLENTGDKPLILIYHTHTTETYQILDRDFYAEGFLSRSNDENLNMIRVGKAMKEELEKMGFGVIHDTAVYDNPYSGAYYRSMDGAEKWLEKYPSIQITIDLHRDAIQDDEGVKTKPVAVIDGKKAAQIMIIAGCQEEGNGITDLPDWEENFTFALKLQKSMETLYPGLTRPIYFCARSYNMALTPCSLLVEVGTDANTLGEAVYSARMLGRAMGEMLGAEIQPY